jgi:hypothetical protein
MAENIRGGKKSKEGEKGDSRCYCPCQKCSFTRPVRILIATTKNIVENMGTLMRIFIRSLISVPIFYTMFLVIGIKILTGRVKLHFLQGQ